MQKYFDFHFHPVFKAFISDFEAKYPTKRPSHEFLKPFDLTNAIMDFVDSELLHILEGQSSLEQIKKGNFTLGVASIAPIEKFFSYKNGFFGKILNSRMLTSPLDHRLMDWVREGKISYYQLFLREIQVYHFLNHTGTLHLLTRKNNNFVEDGTNLVIAIEGGHALHRAKIGTYSTEDEMLTHEDDELSDDFANHPLLTPADSLRHLHHAMWEMDMDIFSLVLTHLSNVHENFLATHAYGMKLLDVEESYPAGNGISRKGKSVIDAAYQMKSGEKDTPILIDIKHMSLKSRLDFYDYRKNNGYHHFPIIASHMGVTGYSISEWQEATKKVKVEQEADLPKIGIYTGRETAGEWGAINKVFTFNPWSINLMNEDIVEIIQSDGLIGLSLDVRILGWQDMLTKEDQVEYISVEDFKYFFPEKFQQFEGLLPQEVESWLIPVREERHPLALCFNLLHIISVGKLYTDKNPWDNVCIGSDFDGLINPIINCRNSTKSKDLGPLLLRWLPVAEMAYRNQNAGPPLLDNSENKLEVVVEKFLYTNGLNFVTKRGFMDGNS
jgi:microsomal dipeptidase-like Zn-dependent dipeptidase